MTRRPETSGASREGEALGAPDELRPCGTHAAIKRHRNRGEALCDACAEYQRTYNREYARVRLQSAVFRSRRNEAKRQRDRVIYTDPAKVAAINARRRQQHREALEQARREARVDAVVVARLIDGEPVSHNRAERLEAVRQLRSRGLAYKQIAARLSVLERQVHRDLTDLRLTRQGAVA